VVIEKMTGTLSRERAESPERSGGTVHPEKFEFGLWMNGVAIAAQALRLY
jgi:hypothetical protein